MILPETLASDGESVIWRRYGSLARSVGAKETSVTLATDGTATPTVRVALDELVHAHPELHDDVLDDDEELRENVAVFHNHLKVFAETDRLNSEVHDGDTLALAPSVW